MSVQLKCTLFSYSFPTKEAADTHAAQLHEWIKSNVPGRASVYRTTMVADDTGSAYHVVAVTDETERLHEDYDWSRGSKIVISDEMADDFSWRHLNQRAPGADWIKIEETPGPHPGHPGITVISPLFPPSPWSDDAPTDQASVHCFALKYASPAQAASAKQALFNASKTHPNRSGWNYWCGRDGHVVGADGVETIDKSILIVVDGIGLLHTQFHFGTAEPVELSQRLVDLVVQRWRDGLPPKLDHVQQVRVYHDLEFDKTWTER